MFDSHQIKNMWQRIWEIFPKDYKHALQGRSILRGHITGVARSHHGHTKILLPEFALYAATIVSIALKSCRGYDKIHVELPEWKYLSSVPSISIFSWNSREKLQSFETVIVHDNRNQHDYEVSRRIFNWSKQRQIEKKALLGSLFGVWSVHLADCFGNVNLRQLSIINCRGVTARISHGQRGWSRR